MEQIGVQNPEIDPRGSSRRWRKRMFLHRTYLKAQRSADKTPHKHQQAHIFVF